MSADATNARIVDTIKLLIINYLWRFYGFRPDVEIICGRVALGEAQALGEAVEHHHAPQWIGNAAINRPW
jgi:hypothetical protein